MSFRKISIGQNTKINQDFLNSMTRNDDVVKSYYESSSYGILGWYESESNTTVSSLDPDSLQDNGEDPNWPTLASLTIYPENNRVIKMSFNGLTVMQEAPGDLGTTSIYNHAINSRFLVEYPDDTGLSVIPYRYVAPGTYIAQNDKKELGAIFGHSFCIATDEILSLININYPASKTPSFSTFIKPKKVKVNFQIRRLNINQTITANSESKLQILIQDIGAWRI